MSKQPVHPAANLEYLFDAETDTLVVQPHVPPETPAPVTDAADIKE